MNNTYKPIENGSFRVADYQHEHGQQIFRETVVPGPSASETKFNTLRLYSYSGGVDPKAKAVVHIGEDTISRDHHPFARPIMANDKVAAFNDTICMDQYLHGLAAFLQKKKLTVKILREMQSFPGQTVIVLEVKADPAQLDKSGIPNVEFFSHLLNSIGQYNVRRNQPTAAEQGRGCYSLN